MDTTITACWADPLYERERATLAAMLARASRRFTSAWPRTRTAGEVVSQIRAAAEMTDLRWDLEGPLAGLPAWEASDPCWRCPVHDQTLVYEASEDYDEHWHCPVIGCGFGRLVG